MLQTPVGFASTWVTVTKSPLASVDTARLVTTGGIVTVACPFESVVDTTIGWCSVVSGRSVIVLVEVGVCAFAWFALGLETMELEESELVDEAGAADEEGA